jgi:hypothetical protein
LLAGLWPSRGSGPGDPPGIRGNLAPELIRPAAAGIELQDRLAGTKLKKRDDWNFFLSTNNIELGRLDETTAVDDGGGYWHADVIVPSEVRPNSGVLTYVPLPSSCHYTLRINEDATEAGDISEVFCLGVPVVSVRVSCVDVCWTSRSNRTYQVQYRPSLTNVWPSLGESNVWRNLGASVQGNGSTNCITDAVTSDQPQRYYRIEELP